MRFTEENTLKVLRFIKTLEPFPGRNFEIQGKKIKYIPIKPKKSFLKGIVSKSFYSRDLVDTKKIINDMMGYMESRNIWGRYGF